MKTNEKIVRIVADSSCDKFVCDGVEFASAPLTISTDERSFVDDEKIDIDEMLDYLSKYKGRSYTSCPGINDWLKCYDGADIIYVVVLSSGVSGSYGAAVAAADIYKEKHPEVKIEVFDTKSAGPHVRLVVDRVANLVKAGAEFDEICSLTREYLKHTRVFFALESFHNFAENGRVNKTVAKLAGVLGVRVMATASPQGEIEIIKKCRGEQGTLKGFLECLEESGYNGGKCYIAQCKNLGFAEDISNAILSVYPHAAIDIYETRGLCSFYAEKGGILMSFETV